MGMEFWNNGRVTVFCCWECYELAQNFLLLSLLFHYPFLRWERWQSEIAGLLQMPELELKRYHSPSRAADNHESTNLSSGNSLKSMTLTLQSAMNSFLLFLVILPLQFK